ncbi:MAG: CHRD domain-containing protein [Alphaproteobacteria bacterium]|nr:CHRD domain-containing protein [Alphaproteobacteria bacterium]MBV9371338.1 CHRD domain-containing protein [Alphaproteobacteria bacterium]MBV9901802.1 CHRD domain-containing protein [Alphaproteobacteria bacterium]
MKVRTPIGGLVALAAAAAAVPAQAKVLTFHAALDGTHDATGSAATGKARVRVDTTRQRVSVDLTVDGITLEALWDKLVAAPIGPIHFHKYASLAGGDSVLVLPLPYGAAYRATPHGLRVTMRDYDYRAGGRLVNSTLSFDDFVAAMRSGLVVLNVHTDSHNAGEISGKVTEG